VRRYKEADVSKAGIKRTLVLALATAKEKNIPVIAYGRLIVDTDAVSYYVTFDDFLVGVKQGEYIEEALDLKNAVGPFNIEPISGYEGDIFFNGAMSVLNPYIGNGAGVIPSYLCEHVIRTADNWRAMPIDSGHYDESLFSDVLAEIQPSPEQ
jgi:putative multiple sugar transport system substrate-binding protein